MSDEHIRDVEPYHGKAGKAQPVVEPFSMRDIPPDELAQRDVRRTLQSMPYWDGVVIWTLDKRWIRYLDRAGTISEPVAAPASNLVSMANAPSSPSSAPKANPSLPIRDRGDAKANATPTKGGVK